MVPIFALEPNKFVIYGNDIPMSEWRDLINEVAKWCKELTGNDYETWNIDDSGCTFSFDNDEDRAAFMLRWVNCYAKVTGSTLHFVFG